MQMHCKLSPNYQKKKKTNDYNVYHNSVVTLNIFQFELLFTLFLTFTCFHVSLTWYKVE